MQQSFVPHRWRPMLEIKKSLCNVSWHSVNANVIIFPNLEPNPVAAWFYPSTQACCWYFYDFVESCSTLVYVFAGGSWLQENSVIAYLQLLQFCIIQRHSWRTFLPSWMPIWSIALLVSAHYSTGVKLWYWCKIRWHFSLLSLNISYSSTYLKTPGHFWFCKAMENAQSSKA